MYRRRFRKVASFQVSPIWAVTAENGDSASKIPLELILPFCFQKRHKYI